MGLYTKCFGNTGLNFINNSIVALAGWRPAACWSVHLGPWTWNWNPDTSSTTIGAPAQQWAR